MTGPEISTPRRGPWPFVTFAFLFFALKSDQNPFLGQDSIFKNLTRQMFPFGGIQKKGLAMVFAWHPSSVAVGHSSFSPMYSRVILFFVLYLLVCEGMSRRKRKKKRKEGGQVVWWLRCGVGRRFPPGNGFRSYVEEFSRAARSTNKITTRGILFLSCMLFFFYHLCNFHFYH